MNIPALDEALQDLADGPSNAASVRATVARRIDATRRRRRTAALISAAAAVVLIVGGIGVVAKSHIGSPTVATPPDWRHDHPVVIPAGSQLIPYLAPPLISPVTVTAGGPPAGYLANHIADVDRVYVSWPNAPYNSPDFGGPVGYQVDHSVTVGYLASSIGEKLAAPPQVSTEQEIVNGHTAQFSRTPTGTKQWGFLGGSGVRTWLTWRLSDGSYIHVWNVADDKPTLLTLAKGIIEKPSALGSSISLGVTLPGLTARYSDLYTMAQNAPNTFGEQITLCPAGTSSVQALSAKTDCLTADVQAASPDSPLPSGEIVQIDGKSVHVVAAKHQAWTDLGRGYLADLHGTATMSGGDLALAAASARLDPAVPKAAAQASGVMPSPAPSAPISSPPADDSAGPAATGTPHSR